jgi:hypothetical protein
MSAPITPTSFFRGVGFRITNNQLGMPEDGFTTLFQKDHIPYGDDSVVQIGGSDADDLTFDAIFNTADLPALEALKRTTGTLTILGSAARTALFAKMSNPKRYVDGYTIAALTFVYY